MDELHQLADVYGIETSYYSVEGKLQQATPEAMLPILQALGAPVERREDAAAALRERRLFLARRPVEPVTVIWRGDSPELELVLPKEAPAQMKCHLLLESGEEHAWEAPTGALPFIGESEVEGIRFVARRLAIPISLPAGQHHLRIEFGSAAAQSHILAAPVRACDVSQPNFKTWGVFLPLYALHSRQSWGAGDFSDLEALIDWTREQGGGLVATLPLTAAFLDEPFEPGPYSPASRLFWNEFYVGLTTIPELASCPEAKALLNSRQLFDEIEALRALPLVDYRKQMALKRRVLELLSRCFFARGEAGRRQEFARFLATHPQAEDYAAFRAAVEKTSQPWPAWPAPQRDGNLRPNDYDEENKRYHLYVQWIAEQQLERLSAKAREAGLGFYLDFPLGVNPDSYDVWRHRDVFASGIAAGAPPDPFFASGQNWGFPPLHPERVREHGYRYVTAYLRHHLKLAGVLRIDHMMGIHRLFWIPHGFEARQGVYVRYRPEEFYALFTLESHRSGSVLVGEDLGTVPPEVRPAMEKHGIHRMYIMQFEVHPEREEVLAPVYPGCVASLNTHDIAPFSAFWEGLDLKERLEIGNFDPRVVEGELHQRRRLGEALIRALLQKGLITEEKDPNQLLQGCLEHMCQGTALVVLLNLEDIWQELKPQNIPGTWRERPNWRLRARYSLEEMKDLPAMKEALRLLKEKGTGVRGRYAG
jgi:4-alpha-glucanotransferase